MKYCETAKTTIGKTSRRIDGKDRNNLVVVIDLAAIVAAHLSDKGE